MKLFAESIDLGDGAIIFIAGWVAIALSIALFVNYILTSIGVKIARRKNKRKSILSTKGYSLKPYLITSSILLVIALGSVVSTIFLVLMPLLIVVSPYIGYFYTIEE